MSLLYDFQFGPTYVGVEAVVTDLATGDEVAGSPAPLDADGHAQLSLAEGRYQAVVHDARMHQTVLGVLNVAASIRVASVTPIPHYEATWILGFNTVPDVIIESGDIDVTIGPLAGVVGTTSAKRQLILPVGIYYVAWGGLIGAPDATPDVADDLTYGEWYIGWDDSIANLRQEAIGLSPVSVAGRVSAEWSGTPDGGLLQGSTGMVVPILDATDRVAFKVKSPYGGINTTLIATVAVTRLGASHLG